MERFRPMTLHQRRLLPLILLMSLTCLSVYGALPEQPWDRAQFSASAADIAAAVRRIPESKEAGVVMLLDETLIAVDSSNRTTETHHFLYRIGTQSPGDWGVLSAVWQPWRQERPSIRARVVTSDGREVQLDEKTVSESPLTALGIDTFGDGRLLRAPLPALAGGSVVEIETIVKDSSSLFSRGLSLTATVGKEVPVLRSSVTIETPTAMPLKFEVLALPNATTTDEITGGKRIVTISVGKLDPVDMSKVFPASGDNRRPRVSFSTAASWRDVADGYVQATNGVVDPSAVAAVAKEAVGDASNREQIVDRILQKVQHTIRYSAVQLGEAAIVPTAPSETLKLQYGDCKDQAALLVAMLRASGVDAFMALLRAGPDPDVNPNLPGFGEFDHAIVYVSGATPMWLDSTTRFSRAGELPIADQGRLALIIKPDTTELVRTPEFVSRVVETQEVFLSERGPGRIIETREFSGSEEINARALHNEISVADFQSALDKMSSQVFQAKSVRNLNRPDPSDFSAPYKIQFELEGTENASTSGNQAAVFILLASLIEETGFASVNGLDEALYADGVNLPERVARQWSYHIVPPAGYTLGEIPAGKATKMGPATLSQEFTALNDGTVTGTILFDSGKRNYTAAEFAELEKGLNKVLNDSDPVLTVSFDLTAQKLLEDGKVAEALREFRRLIALHPNEAVHHSQIARALINLGMGELARQEARRAVELDPESAYAFDTLGAILETDLIGRRWKSGFELEQARDAYRKAVELTPEDDTIRGDLAISLEVDAKGTRYAPDVDLKPVIEQYKMFKQKPDETSSLQRNLPYALFRTGNFNQLRTASTPADIRIAAIAASDGVAPAVREAGKLTGDARAKALSDASSMLLLHRLYSESAGLLKAANGGSNSPAATNQASQLERTRKFEDLPMPESDPASIARRVMARIIAGDHGPGLKALLSASGQDELRRNPDLSFGAVRLFPVNLTDMPSTPNQTVVDLYMSAIESSHDGDDKGGYRVELLLAQNSHPKHLFVVSENGQYRVLSAGRGDFAAAREALQRIDKGEVDSARRWIDWITDEQQSVLNGDVGIIVADAFDVVWNTGIHKDRDRMRYAAATALCLSPDDAARILPILQEGVTKNTGEVRKALAVAYAATLMTLKRYDESVAAGLKALQSDPHSDVIQVVAQSMMELDHLDDLLKLLKDNLKNSNHPIWIQQSIAAIDVRQGNFPEAEKELRNISAAHDLNIDTQILWLSQYHAAVTAEDVARAQNFVDSRRSNDPFGLRTLAALKAEIGNPTEALELLKQALNASRGDVSTDDWYILGRIYEQFGESESAIAAYRRVTPPERSPLVVSSAYALAQKRLAAAK
jgi:tetratricopeptide (TPR) repeat protein/transglutaminase-like putative cysteine protease